MSLTPDELFQAWGTIINDVFGKNCWKQEPITLAEWKQCDDRWLALKQMNIQKLALKPKAKEGRS